MDEQKLERVLASLANYLVSQGREHIATLIAQSRLTFYEAEWYQGPNDDHPYKRSEDLYVFHVPANLYAMMNDGWQDGEWITNDIYSGIEGILGKVNHEFKIDLLEYDVNWRMRLIAESETQEVTNQNTYAKEPLIYLGMKFSSPPEIEIAKVLEAKGIMCFPNCHVRAGSTNNRQARFPDFLILHKGKWGILEVDGQTYHTAQSATKDHERTQILQMHGIRVFHRYDAMRCKNNPEDVVDEFLGLLELNG